MVSDIAFFIKFRGAGAVSTIDKMLTIDLFNYQVSKENKEKSKNFSLWKARKVFQYITNRDRCA